VSREILQVSTTVGSRDEAVALARDLVERRLAACVQVVGPVESSFRWKGSTEAAQEWVCVAKTTHAGVEALTTAIRAAHTDRKSTRLNSSHTLESRMPSSA